MRFFSALKMLLTLTCDQASRILSHSQEIPLARSERVALRIHLWICRSCRRYRRQLFFLRQILHYPCVHTPTLDKSLPGLTETQRQRLRDILKSS